MSPSCRLQGDSLGRRYVGFRAMIRGVVNSRGEGVVVIEICATPPAESADPKIESVAATVDTGFTGYLMLPLDTVSGLGLPWYGALPMILADGSSVDVDVHVGCVRWLDGSWRHIEIIASNGGALIGTLLLYGSRLTIDVIDGGPMTITPLA